MILSYKFPFLNNNIALLSGVMIIAITLIVLFVYMIGFHYDGINANANPEAIVSAILSSSPVKLVWADTLNRTLEASQSSSLLNSIKIDVTSVPYVHGVAGQFIKIKGTITNNSPNNASIGGIAYISIVDIKDKIPVDLEDWSAEKGLYIPAINAGESLPLEWNLRLVKAGSYTVDILFNIEGNLISPPIASSKISLEVAPKVNLNPGNVLPIAFGVPAVLIAIMGTISYARGKKTGIYS
jgi:hypothetical protein